MNIRKYIVIGTIVLLFCSCKSATEVVNPSGSDASLYEMEGILDTTQVQFLNYADQNNGNADEALMQTAKWLESQPTIQSVNTLDSTYIFITMKSGIDRFFYK